MTGQEKDEEAKLWNEIFDFYVDNKVEIDNTFDKIDKTELQKQTYGKTKTRQKKSNNI